MHPPTAQGKVEALDILKQLWQRWRQVLFIHKRAVICAVLVDEERPKAHTYKGSRQENYHSCMVNPQPQSTTQRARFQTLSRTPDRNMLVSKTAQPLRTNIYNYLSFYACYCLHICHCPSPVDFLVSGHTDMQMKYLVQSGLCCYPKCSSGLE